MIKTSVITCPKCEYQTVEQMPTDACQYFYVCKGCDEKLKPKPNDCCVFCSYGSVRCPPAQAQLEVWCPLLALSRHQLVRRTCLLSGPKQTPSKIAGRRNIATKIRKNFRILSPAADYGGWMKEAEDERLASTPGQEFSLFFLCPDRGETDGPQKERHKGHQNDWRIVHALPSNAWISSGPHESRGRCGNCLDDAMTSSLVRARQQFVGSCRNLRTYRLRLGKRKWPVKNPKSPAATRAKEARSNWRRFVWNG